MTVARRGPWLIGLAFLVSGAALADPPAFFGAPETLGSRSQGRAIGDGGVIAPPCLSSEADEGAGSGALQAIKCQLPAEPAGGGAPAGGETPKDSAQGPGGAAGGGAGAGQPPAGEGTAGEGGAPAGGGASGEGTSGGTAGGTASGESGGQAGGGEAGPGGTETPPPVVADPGFRYHPPGNLQKNDSRGRKDRIVYLSDIIFPIRLGPGQFGHMNSQIYGYGGCCGPGGSYSNPANWDPMNQWDNYCEDRGHKMPLCTGAGGKGHQGQDIRPPSNKLAFYDAIAVVDGLIVSTSNYTSSVKLKGPDGTDYLYLHLEPSSIKVTANQKVKRGDVLGKVANLMNGKRGTSIHLHFQAQQTIEYGGKKITAWVPVYTSLIAALRKEKGLSSGIVNDSNGGKPMLVAEYPYEYGVPKPPEEEKQPPPEEAKQPPPEEAKQPPPEEAKQPPVEEAKQPPPEEAKQPPPEEAKQPPPEEAKQPPPEEAKQPPPEEAKQPPKEEPSLWRSFWRKLFNWWSGAPK